MQVGTDANAQLVRSALSDCGVDISHLREVKGPTGSAIISVDPQGELTHVLLTRLILMAVNKTGWQGMAAGRAPVMVAPSARQP